MHRNDPQYPAFFSVSEYLFGMMEVDQINPFGATQSVRIWPIYL